MTKLLSWIAVLLIAVAAVPAYAAEADPAAQQIEKFYAALTDSMKRGKELGLQGRYKQLTPIVEDVFDLPIMAQLTVGPPWTMMSDADKKSVMDAFERMTIANYAKNFASFGGEQFTVDPAVQMRGTDKIVQSKLTNSDKSVVPFNYRMHMAGDKWKIVDIFLNGYVSQLALRRSDFASTVAGQGAAGLVKRMNEMVDKQMAGG